MTQEQCSCYLIHHLIPSDGAEQYSTFWTTDAFDNVTVCDCLFYINQYNQNKEAVFQAIPSLTAPKRLA